MADPIGFLITKDQWDKCFVVCCNACAKRHPIYLTEAPGGYAKLFVENILPYKQSCHKCGNIIVPGQTPAWSELFSKHASISHMRAAPQCP